MLIQIELQCGFRAGPEYSIIRIFVRWVGIRFSILRFGYPFFFFFFFFFFFYTWHPSRNGSQLVRLAEHLQQTVRQWKTFVLTYSMHIFHEKSSISYKRTCRTSTFEIMNLSTQKTRHVNGALCYHKTECDSCVFFVNCPEMRAKVLDQRAVALVVQTRCADVKLLWESEREDAVQLNHSRCFQMTDLIW